MNLRKVREQHNIRICDLVKASGVPRASINSIERLGNCQVTTAIKLADAMQISLDELCRS